MIAGDMEIGKIYKVGTSVTLMCFAHSTKGETLIVLCKPSIYSVEHVSQQEIRATEVSDSKSRRQLIRAFFYFDEENIAKFRVLYNWSKNT
jgi:hypothetical protein